MEWGNSLFRITSPLLCLDRSLGGELIPSIRLESLFFLLSFGFDKQRESCFRNLGVFNAPGHFHHASAPGRIGARVACLGSLRALRGPFDGKRRLTARIVWSVKRNPG